MTCRRAIYAVLALVLLSAAFVAAAQDGSLALSCARPVPDAEIALRLPATIVVDDVAADAQLVVEERSVDIELVSDAQTIDLPPSRHAYEPISLHVPRAQIAVRARAKSVDAGTFRVQLFCGGDTAGLKLLAQAGAKLSASEDSSLARAVRPLRKSAVSACA